MTTKDKDQLEKDFNEIKDAVNAKLKEAAEALREAQKIAATKGLKLMESDTDWRPTKYLDDDYSLYFDVNQIEDAMDAAGWSTSSWYC